jgi:hypothetical protein
LSICQYLAASLQYKGINMAKKKTIKRVLAGLPKGVTSGSELIRAQLAKGNDKPAAIVAAIKTETGVEVSSALVNNVKMTLKKKAGKVPKALKRGPKAKQPGNETSLGNNRGNEGRNLTAVEVAIQLTEKFGAAKARQMIDALGQ